MSAAFASVRRKVATQLHELLRAHGLMKVARGGRTGFWVGFWLDPAAAEALAIPGGEPAADLHVTLAYVPDAAALKPTQLRAAVEALRIRATAARPFEGAITGAGRFDGGTESDAQDVLYAVPDVPRLAAFRQEVVEALAAVGLEHSREHEWTPHVAVQYVPRESAAQIDPPTVPLHFDTLCVRWGDEQVTLPLGPLPLTKATRQVEADDPQVESILRALDLEGFAVLLDPTAALLEAIGLNGARQGLLTVKALAPDAEDIALPSDTVADWARERAAALVGKRVLEDGTVIDNPNPAYAIDEATRELLRGTIADAFREEMTFSQLEDALATSYAFSDDRAETIARNEIGRALEEGNRAAWRASGVVTEIEILLSDLHDQDDECDDAAGVYPIDEAPDVPIHVNCACSSIALVGGEEA